jgi:hypothetical protein
LRRCWSVMKLHIGLLRRDRWATRSAVDARRANRCDEPPVEATIATLDDAVAVVVVEWWHASIMTGPSVAHQRKSVTHDEV